MSATVPPSTDDSSKKDRLKQYLLDRTKNGETYFKSKLIADDVGLSSKRIGALIVKLHDSAADLSIEKWPYTSATTWHVETV